MVPGPPDAEIMTGSHNHPTFCATRGLVPCGDHLAEPATIPGAGDGRLEIAAARTGTGMQAVAVTAVDAETGRAVTVLLRHRAVTAAALALLTHDELARS